LRWFVGRREVFAAVGLAYERAVEANQMIDAESVVELAAAPRPLPQPVVVPFRNPIPAIDRHPPVLTGFREGIRRRSDRRVETELVLSRPDVGAVAAHHEREIAEQSDVGAVRAGALPLLVGEPLQVLVVEDRVGQAAARVLERGRVAIAQLGLPVAPVAGPMLVVKRPEQGIVLEPPGLTAQKIPERP
jgi:hypothetical protein